MASSGKHRYHHTDVLWLSVLCVGGLLVSFYLHRIIFLFPLLLATLVLLIGRRPKELTPYRDLLPGSLWMALLAYLGILLIASMISHGGLEKLSQMLVTLIGPLALALIAGRAIDRKVADQRVFVALLAGGLLVGINDTSQYFCDFATSGSWVSDFSHRWRVTAYILFLPFLLLFRDGLVGRTRALLNVALLCFFLLAALTGSRTAWGTVMLEIVALGVLTRDRQYFFDLAAFSVCVALSLALLPYDFGTASAERGLGDNNRIEGHWLPALQQSMGLLHALLIGQGYGTEVIVPPQLSGTGAAVAAGPHNVFLQALLAGGVAALISLLWLFKELGNLFWRYRHIQDLMLKKIAVGGLVAFTGYFIIAGQVGDPRPEPLALFVLLAMLLHRSRLTVQRDGAA